MVLPAPPAHASPAQPRWFDKLVVAIELSAGGVLTLVDNAAPARLREVYLRLYARDPATEVIVDVRRLAELPPGTTVILALSPSSDGDDLDWLNLNRPVISDRRHNVVLWCEGDAAAILARRAPDFFDWISARVDCPPAAAVHAVADLHQAIRARACGIAWAGPGLEETLSAVRPGRPVRRVAVASYQSMLEALTSHGPGWLVLEGIDTGFHLRRLRWAMAETGRRVIVFRRAFDRTAPGWWTVHAMHVPIAEAVHALAEAGGTGRLAALTGLDPAAFASAVFLLRGGVEAARLEDQLAATSDPRAALQDFARTLGGTLAGVFTDQPPRQISVALRHAFESEAARHASDNDPIVSVLRGRPREPERWTEIGTAALDSGDFEVAIRWLTAALGLLSADASLLRVAGLLTLRGRAHHIAGELASARVDLERAYAIARSADDASMIVKSAAWLGNVLLDQGEPLRAHECLESALRVSTELGDEEDVATLLNMLAMSLLAQCDLAGARLHAERALSIKRRVFASEDHPSIAVSLGMLGGLLAAQGDLEGAHSYLERSLEINERLLGLEHPRSVSTLRALAEVHWLMGDLSSARARLERARAIQRAVLGSDEHPDIADTLALLARVIAAGGDLDGAQAMLERALATQQKVFGNDGQLAGATTRRALADVLVAKGDLAGALEHLERALATQRRIFERDDHPEVASTIRELERLQRLQGDLQRAD